MSTTEGQTRPESQASSDDRALLLPCFRKDSLDIENQGKTTIVDANRDVYTITDESLPSHMRSLLPSHEQHVHDLLTLERTRRRLRYVIISLSVLLALTVLVAVTLVFSLKVKSTSALMEASAYSPASRLSTDTEMTEVATEVKISLLSRNKDLHGLFTDIADRKIIGRHVSRNAGPTRLSGSGLFVTRASVVAKATTTIQTLVCVAKYKHCLVQRKPPSKSTAKLFGKNQTTYSCQTASRDLKGVHVISIFGNHRSSTTKVTVNSLSSSDKILVLVNYHFVTWTVHLPKNSGITKVFVVSVKWLSQADHVVFQGTSEEPPVFYKLSLTGYGQDKNGGHTPKLLQFIEEEIGPVTSFLGTSHADEITVHLDDDDKPMTSKRTVDVAETTTQ